MRPVSFPDWPRPGHETSVGAESHSMARYTIDSTRSGIVSDTCNLVPTYFNTFSVEVDMTDKTVCSYHGKVVVLSPVLHLFC